MVSLGNIRIILALLVTLAIVGIVATISLKGSKQAPLEPVQRQLPQNIDVAMHNARFTEISDGTTVWELVADRAEYDKSGEVAYLTGIHMEFAKTRSAGTVTVTADRGEYSSKDRNVKLRGSVHVTTESKASFKSESIDYLAARSLFRTSDQVAFNHQRLSLTAKGMELNVKDQKAHFLNSVEAKLAGL
jgi:LPS export ABC transporter protein LptC